MQSDTRKAGNDDWKETCIHGTRPDWFTALDDDLRERLAPFLWVEELNTGAWKMREHDWWQALRDFAVTIQAQRVEVRRLRDALDGDA